ncbi:3-hydroxyacyl-CoA dehydrogenase family protein [Sporosarcina sp. G11-34]|uniref:3-hydroxyacyl-CoA dehydrogenase family protein n=1 Tax=Sporosarcina sp. G11-34 TaxID=2849605 RepID=UPI0022A9BD66|nr:3-hydroxyacyl-CoA dehydrogenase family protein [Sporosarcina sp. G11-34]MCZ2258096.1 3-hydroxyacyl-CoA dehydrogenase family protein [Sporosarcina sp. G11-34]
MEKIGVIGCGTMGHSIALSAAWAGYDVIMQGVDSADIDRGLASMHGKLQVLIQNGLIAEVESQRIQSSVQTTTSIVEVVEDRTFIIEAIPENIELKKRIFKQLDSLCEVDVILASNTSALSPTEIASETNHPERTVITHFWHPAHLIPLVEVVRGEQTNDHTVERALKLMVEMNKKPIEVKKEAPGFVGNRLQFALLREAQHILEEGIASKEDIDAAVVYSIGRRLPVTGPILSADMGGLDVYTDISNYLYNHLSTATQSTPSMAKLVNKGKFGNKTGEGYYKWDASFSEEVNSAREKELIRYLKQDMGLN